VEPSYIVCWLSIYFGISSSFLFQVALVDPVVRIAAPPQSIQSWGRSLLKSQQCDWSRGVHIILSSHDTTNAKSSKQVDAVENPQLK